MSQPIDGLVKILSELVYKDKVLLKLCFNLVFYSLDMSLPEQKQAVLQIYDDYVALYGQQLKWTINPKTENWKKLKNGPDSYTTPHDWLLNEPKNNGFIIFYHGLDKDEDAADITMYAHGENLGGVKRRDLSLISCRFPLTDILNGQVNLPGLFYRWCCYLKPYHAHGGFCIGRCPGVFGMREYYSSLEVELLLRFPGLQLFDYCEGINFGPGREGLFHGPRCADWLMALSGHFVEKLGGIGAIAQKMNILPYQTYEGGIALQAGDAPGLGNKEGASLPDYIHLAQIIEPIRSKTLSAELYLPYNDPLLAQMGLPPGDPQSATTRSREVSDMWHNRFSS